MTSEISAIHVTLTLFSKFKKFKFKSSKQLTINKHEKNFVIENILCAKTGASLVALVVCNIVADLRCNLLNPSKSKLLSGLNICKTTTREGPWPPYLAQKR